MVWENLKAVKSKFENEGLIKQWNWMFVALWFGLRPSEVDSLKLSKFYRTEYDVRNKINVIHVYQTKLTSLSKDKRWKVIPVFFNEQKIALEMIGNKDFKRPLVKTLKRIFNNPKIETYSPRKGFTDLMLEKGFSLEDISTFLGHNSIDMTWKHYKNKLTYKLPG